jgi:hypothetical protein
VHGCSTRPGKPQGSDFILHTVATGTETMSDSAVFADRRSVTVFADFTNSTIAAQLLNSDGSPAAAEFVISTAGFGADQHPAVAVLANGRYVVAWIEGGPSGPSAVKGSS